MTEESMAWEKSAQLRQKWGHGARTHHPVRRDGPKEGGRGAATWEGQPCRLLGVGLFCLAVQAPRGWTVPNGAVSYSARHQAGGGPK